MAFDDSEKAQIRMYLGFPDGNRSDNPRLENRLVDNLSHSAEDQCRLILTKLESVDTLLEGDVLDSSGVSEVVGELKFFPSGDQNGMRSQVVKQGRMLVGRLSVVLGVPRVGDVFSGRGYGGDSWMGRSFQYGNSGPIVLG